MSEVVPDLIFSPELVALRKNVNVLLFYVVKLFKQLPWLPSLNNIWPFLEGKSAPNAIKNKQKAVNVDDLPCNTGEHGSERALLVGGTFATYPPRKTTVPPLAATLNPPRTCYAKTPCNG